MAHGFREKLRNLLDDPTPDRQDADLCVLAGALRFRNAAIFSRMSRIQVSAALHVLLWLLLGTWLGGFALFPIVAITAFRALPSSDAGLVVGPVLAALHLYGVAAGFAVAGLSHTIGRSARLWGLPLLLSALCCYSHFGVSSSIAEIRPEVFGHAGNEFASNRFNELHRTSMLIFYSVMGGVALLVGLNAHASASVSLELPPERS